MSIRHNFEQQVGLYGPESREAALDRESTSGNILDSHMPPFFDDAEKARNGLRAHLLSSSLRGDIAFITTRLDTGSTPEIYAGIVDIPKVNKYELTYADKHDYISLPVNEACSFGYFRNEQDNLKYVPVKIITRRDGFRPRIFLGTPEELRDMITRPVDSKNTSFRSFLGRIHPNSLKAEDEKILKLTNELFYYFELF